MFTDPDAQLVMPTPSRTSRCRCAGCRWTGPSGTRARARRSPGSASPTVRRSACTRCPAGRSSCSRLRVVLATEPAVLVCDEPTTLLDLRWRRVVDDLLDGLDQQVVRRDARPRRGRAGRPGARRRRRPGRLRRSPVDGVAHYRALMAAGGAASDGRADAGHRGPARSGCTGPARASCTGRRRAPSSARSRVLGRRGRWWCTGPVASLGLLAVARGGPAARPHPAAPGRPRGLGPCSYAAVLLGAYQWWPRGPAPPSRSPPTC